MKARAASEVAAPRQRRHRPESLWSSLLRLPLQLIRLSAVFLGAGLVLWVAPPACAQARGEPSEHILHNWTTADGLPDNTVRSITPSAQGYLWIGTAAGIARFDGVRFVAPRCTNSEIPLVESVGHLLEDRSGGLWISGRRGLGRLHHGHYRSLEPDPLHPRYSAAKLVEDHEGTLWISGPRLSRWVRDQIEPVLRADGPPIENVVDMALGRDGSLWVAATSGLWQYRQGQLRLLSSELRVRVVHPTADGGAWVATDRNQVARWDGQKWVHEPPFVEGIRSLIVRRNGDVWAGAYDSAQMWRLRGKERFEVGTRQGFAGISVIGFHEDNEGNLWVGVNGRGLFRVRERRLELYDELHGFDLAFLAGVAEDAAGNLFANVMRKGTYRLVGTRFERIELRNPTGESQIPTTLWPAPEGGLWVGNWYGALARLEGDQIVNEIGARVGTRCLLGARDGTLWRGTPTQGLEHVRGTNVTERFRAPEILPANDVQCLAEDAEGGLWVGTERGICHLHQGKSERYGREHGLRSDNIAALCIDSRGTLWVGTMGGGLSAWVGGRFVTLTIREGLPDDRVLQLIEDDFQQLWLGTRAGMMRVALDELHAAVKGQQRYLHGTLLGQEEGLQWPDCGSQYQPSCIKSHDGRLWFCTSSGLVAVDPRRFATSAPPPRVQIEDVLLDGVSIGNPDHPHQALRIGPLPERLEIRYTGLSFAAPTKVRFRYRLEGHDREVIEAGRRRIATYTRLDPGSYKFQVEAGNNDGVWSPTGASLAITVVPAFWQTWTFAVCATVLGVFLIGGVFWRRIGELKSRQHAQADFARQVIASQERERQRIAIELHDGLGQNLLLAVNRAALGARDDLDPQRARERFQDVEALLRESIQEVRAVAQNLRPAHLEKIGLSKSLEAMVRQVQADSPIQFHVRIDPIDDRILPEAAIQVFRVVQEALNNVIKHSHAREAWVTAEVLGSRVCVEIRDNGRGFDATARLAATGTAGLGLGLAGMAERVRLLGGEWECLSTPGTGTTLRLRLPVGPRRNS